MQKFLSYDLEVGYIIKILEILEILLVRLLFFRDF